MFHLYEKIKNNDVYIIAEMSANHGGSLDNALEIVRQSAKAGADCLKIQTYTADSLTINCDNEYFHIKGGLWDGYKLYDLYKEAGTPYEWHQAIKDECEECGIDFLSTPFDHYAVDFLEELGVEAFKIASYELVDIPLIEYAASKGKPMIISTGMASIEEIQDAIDACRRVRNDNILLLKCCSEYPAPWEDMHLGNIPDMVNRFHLPVGLSDHSAGSLGAVVGVSLGACVVEKHVMLSGIESADSGFSMPMDEFARMVKDVHNAKLIAKGPDYCLTPGEKGAAAFRRSLFAVKDIKAGEKFTSDNVQSIRPGYGILPKYFKALEGNSSSRKIRRGTPILPEDLGVLPNKTGNDIQKVAFRSLVSEDEDMIFSWISNPQLRKMTGTRGVPNREGHHHWFLNRLNDEDNITYIITCNQKPIGLIGTIDYDKIFLNAGIYLYLGNVEEQSKGIGQTAIKMFSEFLFHECGLHKINAWIFSYNGKSIHAFERCGYRLEGIQKEQVIVRDGGVKYYDKLLYGLINPQ